MLSRHGLISYASSLDCPSLLARSVEDVSLLARHCAGRDTLDPTTVMAPIEFTHTSTAAAPLKSLRIGIIDEFSSIQPLDETHRVAIQSVDEATQRLQQLGATVHRLQLPNLVWKVPTASTSEVAALPIALFAYYILSAAEAASNLQRYDGLRYGLKLGGQRGLHLAHFPPSRQPKAINCTAAEYAIGRFLRIET